MEQPTFDQYPRVTRAGLTNQLWRWYLVNILLGCLVAVGYQWRISGGWEWVTQLSVLATWQHLGWFLGGWLLGAILLQIDERWSQQWYESPPMTRSVGFFCALVIVSIFVVTSAGSGVGMGVVMSMLTGIVGEIWIWQTQPAAFRQRFLHDIRPEKIEALEKRWQGKWGNLAILAWMVVVLFSLI